MTLFRRFPKYTLIACVMIVEWSLLSRTVCAGTDVWTRLGPDVGLVSGLLAHPANPDTVFAIAEGQLYRSLDAGNSWSPSRAGFNAVSVNSIAADPVDPMRLFAATSNCVYRSTDGGETWSQIGYPSGAIQTVVLDPSNHNTVYAMESGSWLYRSQDGEPASAGSPQRARQQILRSVLWSPIPGIIACSTWEHRRVCSRAATEAPTGQRLQRG